MKLREIATLLGGELSGDGEIEIERVAKIDEAGPGDITFLANPKYRKFVAGTGASALLVAPGTSGLGDLRAGPRTPPLAFISVANPSQAFLRLVDAFHPPGSPPAPGIHPTAFVAPSARIAGSAAIGPFVAVGGGCVIGARVALHAGTVLEEGVVIGEDALLHARVVVREGCRIGSRVLIHSGAVIGSDGFGFALADDGTYEKIPQRGIVVIEDDAEIGANCTIDRASLGETRIGKGVKLDNLIHIAHNVAVGDHTVIAAQTGVSGSTRIGKHCRIAGQVGLTGHIEIAERTTIGAKSGVPKSIPHPGQTHFGYPAFEIHETLRMQAALRQLPSLLTELRALRQRVEQLEARLAGGPPSPAAPKDV